MPGLSPGVSRSRSSYWSCPTLVVDPAALAVGPDGVPLVNAGAAARVLAVVQGRDRRAVLLQHLGRAGLIPEIVRAGGLGLVQGNARGVGSVLPKAGKTLAHGVSSSSILTRAGCQRATRVLTIPPTTAKPAAGRSPVSADDKAR